MASTTNVPNLNASSLNGATFAAPGAIGGGAAGSGAFTALSASGIVSGTGFSNYLASPPAIGGTAAAAGTFTTLGATTYTGGALSGTFSGTPILSGANFITRANMAQVAASSLSGNPTGSIANESAVTLGSTLNFSGTTLNATTATASQLGVVKPDGTTITASGGVLTAIGAAAASVTVGTTTVGGGTSGQVLSNNGGVLRQVALGGPYFKVHQATAQSLTSTAAKITFDTVDFNAAGAWNATTHVYTPLTAGTYETCAYVPVSATYAAGNLNLVDIQKNGTFPSGTNAGEWFLTAGGAINSLGSVGGCTLVQMNGSTDTLEVDASSQGTLKWTREIGPNVKV